MLLKSVVRRSRRLSVAILELSVYQQRQQLRAYELKASNISTRQFKAGFKK